MKVTKIPYSFSVKSLYYFQTSHKQRPLLGNHLFWYLGGTYVRGLTVFFRGKPLIGRSSKSRFNWYLEMMAFVKGGKLEKPNKTLGVRQELKSQPTLAVFMLQTLTLSADFNVSDLLKSHLV